MIEEVEKVLVILEPKAKSDKVLVSIKDASLAFDFDKVMSFGALGEVIVGACAKSVQESIKKLPGVEDVEKSGTVTICGD